MNSSAAPNGRQPPGTLPHQRRRHSRVMRFFSGYLMFVGALTTLYVLAQVVVLVFVEIGKWMP